MHWIVVWMESKHKKALSIYVSFICWFNAFRYSIYTHTHTYARRTRTHSSYVFRYFNAIVRHNVEMSAKSQPNDSSKERHYIEIHYNASFDDLGSRSIGGRMNEMPWAFDSFWMKMVFWLGKNDAFEILFLFLFFYAFFIQLLENVSFHYLLSKKKLWRKRLVFPLLFSIFFKYICMYIFICRKKWWIK